MENGKLKNKKTYIFPSHSITSLSLFRRFTSPGQLKRRLYQQIGIHRPARSLMSCPNFLANL
jgi:hypothetical protein